MRQHVVIDVRQLNAKARVDDLTLAISRNFWPHHPVEVSAKKPPAGVAAISRGLSVATSPVRDGTYDIVCAELCGWGHYKMKGRITIESRAAYDKYLADLRVRQNAVAPETKPQGNAE